MKTCSICKQLLPITEFHRATKHSDGLQSGCKSCLKVKQRARYRRNRVRDIEKSKRWNKANPTRAAKNMARCRERRPEFYKEYNKTWKQNNPDRQALMDAKKHAKRRAVKTATIDKITLAEWLAIKARQRNRCWYCNKKPAKLTQDHVVPLIAGGEHAAANIVAACAPCNSSKHKKSIDEFAAERGRLFF